MRLFLKKKHTIKKNSMPGTKKPKAWFVRTKNLAVTQRYFFKGRLGRTRSKFFVQTSRSTGLTGGGSFAFAARGRESGYLTTMQMSNLWKGVKKTSRRFSVSLRRPTTFFILQPTAGMTQSQRKKGGRMGSGKSPLVLHKAALRLGQPLFLAREFRVKPFCVFENFRSLLKKIAVRCLIKYRI